MKSIEERVSELEKTVHFWRGLSITMAMIVVGLAVMLTLIGRRAMRGEVVAAKGEFQSLRAKRIEVVNDAGNVVVALQQAAGGGVVAVSSSKPTDHDVMLFANPNGANVQIGHQGTPRQFGLFTIVNRKPALQVYEENPGGKPKNFHQFPNYSESR